MSLRKKLKEFSIDRGFYGPARRMKRRLSQRAYEVFKQEIVFYSSIISPGDVVFDVGANIGAKTEVFLAIGARVVAFEPQPDCRRELVARCGLSSRLTVVPAAVGQRVGVASLFLNENSGQASLKSDWYANGRTGTIEVPTITLDDAIQTHSVPRFCKIDVEGLELEVLKGLNQKIPMLSLEYHLGEAGVANTFACLERLAAFGSLALNISFAEEPGFVWPRWLSFSEFRDVFPGQAPRTEHFDYGDLFVKVD